MYTERQGAYEKLKTNLNYWQEALSVPYDLMCLKTMQVNVDWGHWGHWGHDNKKE